jgi:hypothetical protein
MLASEESAVAWFVSVSNEPAASDTAEAKVNVAVEAPAAKFTVPMLDPLRDNVRVTAAAAVVMDEPYEPVRFKGKFTARGTMIRPMVWLPAGAPGKNISRS